MVNFESRLDYFSGMLEKGLSAFCRPLRDDALKKRRRWISELSSSCVWVKSKSYDCGMFIWRACCVLWPDYQLAGV